MTPPHPAARPAPAPVDPAAILRQAAAALAAQLRTAPPGGVVSLSVALPAASLPDPLTLDGDTVWAGSDGTTAASGAAFAIDAADPDDLARRFSGWRDSWVRAGDGAPPRAFFAFPFAGDGARLWVPRAQMRRQGDDATLTLSAAAGSSAQASLVAAERMLLGRPAAAAPWEPAASVRTAEYPAAADWLERVAATTAAIAAGRFDKVVLSRCVELALSRPVDWRRVVRVLATRYPDCNVFALPHGGGTVVAASPERLAVKTGDRVVSHCLAGTARRGADPSEDAALAAALLASAKERGEHTLVVAAVTAALAEGCDAIEPAPEPAVMRLRLLQHLWSTVTGRARPGRHLLDVVARLHPTPAVAGWPLAAAMDWLARTGERRDGGYTGAAGWIDADGDGEAAVVLRSALVEGRTARLWAGAGIVAGSSPEAELAETDLKLATLLDGLAQG